MRHTLLETKRDNILGEETEGEGWGTEGERPAGGSSGLGRGLTQMSGLVGRAEHKHLLCRCNTAVSLPLLCKTLGVIAYGEISQRR